MRDDTHKDKNISIEAKVNEGIRLALGYTDCEDAINAYIKYIGELLQADRTYIFEKNEKFQDCNTYEWVADGVTPEIDSLQELEHEICREWYENFEDNECIIIRNVDDIKNTSLPFHAPASAQAGRRQHGAGIQRMRPGWSRLPSGQ